MKIVIKRVGQDPAIEDVEEKLEVLQGLVGGYIEVVPVGNILLVCNEEGKLNDLEPNFRFGDDIIVGNAFFTKGDDEGGFTDLSSLEIERTMCFLKQVTF